MRKIRFIINPISGVGRQQTIEKLIGECLDMSRFTPEVVYTNAPGDATRLATQASGEGCQLVAIVGGDGSVNEVGKGLVNTGTAVAIIPAGSGNGLARHLKIPMRFDQAIRLINTGIVSPIDTATINDQVFVGMAGVGFDALIGKRFSEFGKRGFLSYIRVILREFPKYEPENYRLVIDGLTLERRAFLISFANASQYGNNAVIAPQANIKDGLLDICVVHAASITAIPNLIRRLFNGTMDQTKYAEYFRGKDITIEQHSNLAHIDGEPAVLGNRLQIKVNPLSLNIITPS